MKIKKIMMMMILADTEVTYFDSWMGSTSKLHQATGLSVHGTW